jgi:hypothetical protein
MAILPIWHVATFCLNWLVSVVEDELEMARLCEVLWPEERVSRLGGRWRRSGGVSAAGRALFSVHEMLSLLTCNLGTSSTQLNVDFDRAEWKCP